MIVTRSWIEFSEQVIPDDAPANQQRDMCKAFCSGFLAGTAELLGAINGVKLESKLALMDVLEQQCITTLMSYAPDTEH